MDEQKDIQKRSALSKFIDEKIIRTHPFGSNVSGERAYRRAERIVAALHLLTNHISATEPVRVMIRRRGLGLLAAILALKDEMRTTGSDSYKEAQSLIREIISHARVLSVSGLISIANADVLIEASDELGNFLTLAHRTPLSESVVITKEEFLSVGEVSDRSFPDIKDTRILKDARRNPAVSFKTPAIKVRAEGIVNILKSQGELGIKDIASNLPEYSEKTIQRELVSLIALGRVKKTGLRRWSKYSLT